MSDIAQIQKRITIIENAIACEYQGKGPFGLTCELEYLRARLNTLQPDTTNRVVKICRRISEIEHAIACKDQGIRAEEMLMLELNDLELKLNTLQPANHANVVGTLTEKKLTLFGENMTAFQTLSAVVKAHEQEANAKRNLLLAMLSVDWENLPVDTLVYANDNLNSLKNNGPRYFKGLVHGTKTKFAVFSDGRTSVTTRGEGHFDFCLPVNLMPL